MGTDGPRELPRPPRRVPSGAAALGHSTVIEGRGSRQADPVRRPPRAWYLVPVALAVLAAGVASAFVAREQFGVVDPAEAERAVGPGIVTVLASTCAAGTGRATGFLLGDGKVITVASAILEPVSVAIVTAGGGVRPATVMGIGADGVAVLRVPGEPVDAPAPKRSDDGPAGRAELALVDANQAIEVGLTDDGIRLTSTVGRPVGRSSFGAPVVDARNRVTGMVTGSDAGGATFIDAEAVNRYASTSPPLTVQPSGSCAEAKGPQDPVTPEFSGTQNELSDAALQTFTRYIQAVNRHDFEGIRATYTGGVLRTATPAYVRRQHRTTYLFDARVSEVLPYGNSGGARVRMTFTTIHHTDGPAHTIDGGLRCAEWDLVYSLSRVEGTLKISGLAEVAKTHACDGR